MVHYQLRILLGSVEQAFPLGSERCIVFLGVLQGNAEFLLSHSQKLLFPCIPHRSYFSQTQDRQLQCYYYFFDNFRGRVSSKNTRIPISNVYTVCTCIYGSVVLEYYVQYIVLYEVGVRNSTVQKYSSTTPNVLVRTERTNTQESFLLLPTDDTFGHDKIGVIGGSRKQPIGSACTIWDANMPKGFTPPIERKKQGSRVIN